VKHLFISHCEPTREFTELNSAQMRRYWDLMDETGKDYGVKLIFKGNPWGISESYTFVCQSDKSLDNYIAWRMAWNEKRKKAGLPEAFLASRTITVTSPE
jgi:hypothetical protein